MQIAAAATQFNAYPYREADKKLGLKISPHIDYLSPASKTPSMQKTAIVINIQIKASSADSQKTNVWIQLHGTERTYHKLLPSSYCTDLQPMKCGLCVIQNSIL